MDSEYYRADIDIHSLSEFQLSLLLELTAERRLCFTGEELKSLEASRQNENSYGGGDIVYLDGSILSANADTSVQNGNDTRENLKSDANESPDFRDDGSNAEKNGSDEEDKKGDTPDPPPKVKDDKESGNKGTTEAGKNDSKTENNEATTTREHATTEGTIANPSTTESTSTTEDKVATEKPKTEHTEATTEHQKEDNKVKTCTLQIRCDTILNNKKDLKPGKEVYVPKNGVILETVTVEFQDGDTVFDVLKRTCNAYGIQLEYSYTPLYGSYYIEGINYLYEFDCGSQSGWMYKVNGWFPNYGCSSYVLSDKDTIVWCYTCQGLGADVGGGVY
ncbi:MAG: DUF4430 domain-containing protein [Lachnospiraceae bacterium]|nr:DUF4430 domain-containing protein [Lachnospiraceae bacterium]